MRRIRIILASALVIAVLTLGFLQTSDLLRLDNWSQWAAGTGLFAMGGSVAGDIWWREFQLLRKSRRRRPRKRGARRTRRTKLMIRARRRARAVRRSLRLSNRKVDALVFLGALLLLLTAVVMYDYEDFVDMIRLIFGPRSDLWRF